MSARSALATPTTRRRPIGLKCRVGLRKQHASAHINGLEVPTMSQKQIYYSDRYNDEKYEYRHVMLPKDIAKRVPKTHLMSETEWRNLGVQQSQGWVHYMIHQPGS
ncbi:hypothetical protein CRUP_005729 [Coryphaenoides rupestris]|nr:hypothetical protein CRUP_005729 [Coryphaenoides rupestris]